MPALTADRATAKRQGDEFSFDVAAAVVCRAGGIAVLDAAGNVKPAVTAAGLICAGRFEETVDNSAGAAAAVKAKVSVGVYRYGNSAAGDAITKAEIGDTCYLVDDQTVAKTDGAGTRSAAGKIADVDGAGVWVEFKGARGNPTASAVLDFAAIAAAGSADLAITVADAVVGDAVSLGLPAAPTAGLIFQAFVSAAGTVTVRATNITAAAVDAAAATYRVTVLKP
ncbi:MAG: hypothetical protein ACYCZT_10495 [Thiobacillus sp.]